MVPLTSALGHKRTFCDVEAMFALPPKADDSCNLKSSLSQTSQHSQTNLRIDIQSERHVLALRS